MKQSELVVLPNQSKTYGQKAGGQQEGFPCISVSSDIELRNEAQICEAVTFQVSVQILCKGDIWMSPTSAETKLYAPVLPPRGSIHLGILQSAVCRRMNTALTTQSTGDTVCRLWWKDFLKQEKNLAHPQNFSSSFTDHRWIVLRKSLSVSVTELKKKKPTHIVFSRCETKSSANMNTLFITSGQIKTFHLIQDKSIHSTHPLLDISWP